MTLLSSRLSLSLSLFPLADSVYKAFDSTTAVSARCGHGWSHAFVCSWDPVRYNTNNCE